MPYASSILFNRVCRSMGHTCICSLLTRYHISLHENKLHVLNTIRCLFLDYEAETPEQLVYEHHDSCLTSRREELIYSPRSYQDELLQRLTFHGKLQLYFLNEHRLICKNYTNCPSIEQTFFNRYPNCVTVFITLKIAFYWGYLRYHLYMFSSIPLTILFNHVKYTYTLTGNQVTEITDVAFVLSAGMSSFAFLNRNLFLV